MHVLGSCLVKKLECTSYGLQAGVLRRQNGIFDLSEADIDPIVDIE